MLGKVNRVPVGIQNPEFRLPVGRPFLNVRRGAPLAAKGNHGIDTFHFETEMIDTLLQMTALYFPLGAYGDNRQVQMTVGQIWAVPTPSTILRPNEFV